MFPRVPIRNESSLRRTGTRGRSSGVAPPFEMKILGAAGTQVPEAVAVGRTAGGPSAPVAECVAISPVGRLFRDAAPGLTVLVPYADIIVVSEAVHSRLGCYLFEAEEATGGPTVCTTPLVDHTYIIGVVDHVGHR